LTIAIVSQLEKIEGDDVLPSHKIKAQQNFEFLMEDLKRAIVEHRKKREEEKTKGIK
jgi:hypothetical protein